ncbi:MAG: DUF3524 domain-containing protein [Oscillochloris sp.]|nr:DUF3524 domain-containing protein [Oscillochloris sp.]
MDILWIDPFHGGSHAAVAAGYAARSSHRVHLLTLAQAGGWRWRMRGGAVTLARMARELQVSPDLIVTSDMLDLATFRALSGGQFRDVPVAIYFHENQLTYPLPPGRRRDLSFAWINYTSALAADAVIFNSAFHRRDFLAALPDLLGRFHDYQELETIPAITAKSYVLTPGIDLTSLDQPAPLRSAGEPPVILWNARWEYDKQPERFFRALEHVAAQGTRFRLIVAGEHIDPGAPEFRAARERWAARIVHWGYAPSRAAYAGLLQRADLVVSTAIQEFFGIAVLEALYCGCAPLLPNRLNYPDLLPPDLHATTLYGDAQLEAALLAALTWIHAHNRAYWRTFAEPYRWEVRSPQYDRFFGDLVAAVPKIQAE